MKKVNCVLDTFSHQILGSGKTRALCSPFHLYIKRLELQWKSQDTQSSNLGLEWMGVGGGGRGWGLCGQGGGGTAPPMYQPSLPLETGKLGANTICYCTVEAHTYISLGGKATNGKPTTNFGVKNPNVKRKILCWITISIGQYFFLIIFQQGRFYLARGLPKFARNLNVFECPLSDGAKVWLMF